MRAYRMGITKSEFIKEIQWNMEQDNFIKGTYEASTDPSKGCAVGCSIKSINKLKSVHESVWDHSVYEKYLGIPNWLAELEDYLFEKLSLKRSKTWPLEFSEAINTGANLEKVKNKFIQIILKQNIKIQEENLKNTDDIKIKNIIRDTIRVNKLALSAASDTKSAASAAWSAASAAWSAAWSAASDTESAACAAWSAAFAAWSVESVTGWATSAAWSVESATGWPASVVGCAVESAAVSDTGCAAKSVIVEFYSDELLKVLRECK